MRGQPHKRPLSGPVFGSSQVLSQKNWVCLWDLKKAGWLEGSEGLGHAVGQESIGVYVREAPGDLSRDGMGFTGCCVKLRSGGEGRGMHQGASPKFHPARNPCCS